MRRAGLETASSLAPAPHPRRNGLLWLLALLVCVLALVLIWLLLRGAPAGDLPGAEVSAGAEAQAVSSVAVSASSVATPAPRTFSSAPQAPAVTRHPDGTLSMIGKAYREASPDEASAGVAEAGKAPAAEAPEKREVLALYQQVAKARQKAQAPQTQTPEPLSPPVSQAAPASEFEQLGGVRTLPLATQNAVPSLMYSAHNYNPDGKSSVIINRRLRYEGDQVAEGVTLESIEPEGVILRMGPHRFTLRAKVSWVNM